MLFRLKSTIELEPELKDEPVKGVVMIPNGLAIEKKSSLLSTTTPFMVVALTLQMEETGGGMVQL